MEGGIEFPCFEILFSHLAIDFQTVEESVLSKLYKVRLLSFVSTNALFDAALCFLPSFGHVCAALCFFTGMLFLGVMFVRYNLEIV